MEEQDKNQKKKSSLKIDGTVILCILLIILLTTIAILPPMLRILLPDQVKPRPQVNATPVPVEQTEGILICTKEEETADLISRYVEEYHYSDNIVSYVEIRETKQSVLGGSTPQEDLSLACEDRSLIAQNVGGIEVYCDATLEDSVTKTETIDYNKIDLYALNSVKDEFQIDFENSPLKREVLDKKQQQGYSCD